MNYSKTLSKKYQLVVLLTILISLCMAFSLYGQEFQQSNNMRKSLDFMFEHLDRNSVPTGLLRDFAVEYEDLDLFSGEVALENDNIGNLVRYANLLKTIRSSALHEDPIKDFETFLKRTKITDKRGELNLSIMVYKYARIKANALTDGLIRYENGQVYNTGKDESPYQIDYAMAGCCLNPSISQTNVTFVLPSAFLLINCDIRSIEIDYGTGYRSIMADKSLSANLSNGLNKIVIRTTLKDGRILYAHTIVQVEESISQISTRAIIPYDSLVCEESVTIKGRSYRGISTSAEISIDFAPGRNTLRKPFIIVEGFDPRTSEENPQGEWSFESPHIKRMSQIVRLNRYYDYDIVYVDWVNSEDYIQANAYALIDVIEWVNSRKVAAGSVEPNVIIGHSMGGVIARYALKTMENQGLKHKVSTYISYDAPHLGAHVPVGVLYSFHGIMSFLEGHNVIDFLLATLANADELIKKGKSIAYSTAAQQMLVYSIDPTGAFNNQEHIDWQNELKSLGFPKGDLGTSFQMLAVSNGDYNHAIVPAHYLNTDFTGGENFLSALLPGLACTVIGVGLNDIVAGLLATLPGRNSVSGIFNTYPARKTGDLVTQIRIKYKKSFLWIIPISKELFSYDRYFPGRYFFDTYPSSSYEIKSRSEYGGWPKKFPFVFDYGYDLKANNIPFVPVSSALAFGDGINIIPNNFTKRPQGNDSPFGENYFTHDTTYSHVSFTDDGLNWVIERLFVTIVGPKVGTTGAKYSLSNTYGSVNWSTSNPSIATINSSGILTVKEKGIITLTAKYGNQTYSQIIMVGMPRFVLVASHEPGCYEINAECIDTQFKDYLSSLNEVIKYSWGVKYPNKEIQWIETDAPNLKVQLQGQDEKVIVFLEVIDALGNKSELQHIEINSQDVYVAENQNLLIDSQGVLYKENKKKYSYNSARLYLTYRANIPDKYKGREWMATTAMVLRPFSVPSAIDARDGGPLIKNILLPAELEYIKSNSVDGEVYTFILVLLNFNRKAIQFVPVNFTYKTTI